MKTAIIGLPQSGKRTLFSLLTERAVPPGRRPDEAVEAVSRVRDPRVNVLEGICRPRKTTYAENLFVLCPDVGTGNGERTWLEAARRCDLVCLLARDFESDDVYHPEGAVDAARDFEMIHGELILADMERIDTRLGRLEKEKRCGQTPGQAVEEQALRKCMATLEDGHRVTDAALTQQEEDAVRSLDLVTRIAVLETVNVAEDALQSEQQDGRLGVSCRIEQEIMAMDDAAERAEFLRDLGLDVSGVDRVNGAAYAAQGLMSYYTVGEDEVRAWTVRCGATAPVAGGKIHSDIERGFIRVEITKYDDFVETGSEKAAKEAGKVQLRGKDYVMEDGDICHFLFNV